MLFRSLLSLCVCAEIGSSKFFRLDDSKVLAWLYHKVRFHLLKLNFSLWGCAKLEEPTFCLFFRSIWVRDLINTNLTSKCLRSINLTFLSALHYMIISASEPYLLHDDALSFEQYFSQIYEDPKRDTKRKPRHP